MYSLFRQIRLYMEIQEYLSFNKSEKYKAEQEFFKKHGTKIAKTSARFGRNV